MKQKSIIWSESKDLVDLCKFTNQWLRGERTDHITQSSPPDEETDAIKDDLIWLNEHCFFTDFSQPATPLKNGCAQRASVSGFCSEIIAKKIATLCISSDLIVFAFPPVCFGGYFIPITIENYRPFTWIGTNDENNVTAYSNLLGEESLKAITDAWYVIIIDPVWGREKYIWSELKHAIEYGTGPYCVCPSPLLQLDVDFIW